MEVKVECGGNVANVYLTGDLDINSSDAVTSKVLGVLEGVSVLNVDMSGCRYISSSGLRSLLTVYKTAKLKGCTMKLENLTEGVRDIIQMTGFGLMFGS